MITAGQETRTKVAQRSKTERDDSRRGRIAAEAGPEGADRRRRRLERRRRVREEVAVVAVLVAALVITVVILAMQWLDATSSLATSASSISKSASALDSGGGS